MSNRTYAKLDALASSVEEINGIEKLLAWVAQRNGTDPKNIAASIKELVSFDPVDSIRAYLAAMEDYEFDHEKAAEFMEDE
jgi:hypothetical protein